MLIISGAFSQEVITGLQYNEAVKQKAIELAKSKKILDQATIGISEKQALELPFLDDFSTSSVYPDTTKWLNSRSVFVNKDFPYLPPNIAAATFDAVDSVGNLYPDATWIPFKADVMTSAPIRLDSVFTPVARPLTPADSIYLSFFYQPQGYGDAPEADDSLLLQFARRGDTVFQYVDSAYEVSVQFFLTGEDDTLKPGDTLRPPAELGCDTSITWINLGTYTWEDKIQIPCDSVFWPDTIWDTKWYAEGMKLDTFVKNNNGKYFAQVLIPVFDSLADTAYFYDSFQFRFRNYASIEDNNDASKVSNVDFWNIDYVYLNNNRTINDTSYRVLAFTERAPSFLQNYQSMPYRQYRADAYNAVRKEFYITASNLDKIAHNSNYRYKVDQVNGDFNYAYDGGNLNVFPGYKRDTIFVQKLFNLDYDRDTTSYIIKHYISDSSELNILVDSAVYHQGFYNYFAYDDGTPEFGYGVKPIGAMAAYQFKLSTPDTLRGVQMYFNRTKDNANNVYFNIVVWRDNNGRPGEIAYKLESQKPRWEDGLYQFHAYLFNEPIILSGTFYIGWEIRDNNILNVGFDANNYYETQRIFFNIDHNNWYSSEFEGSLLIRPIVGPDMILSDPENYIQQENELLIYPNPASDKFSFFLPNPTTNELNTVTIYNLFGSMIYHETGIPENINISHFAKGMYIVKVKSGNAIFTGKLLVNH